MDNEDTQALNASKKKTDSINKDKQSRRNKEEKYSSSSCRAYRFRQKNINDIKCFSCRKNGHYKSECPKLKKSSGKSDDGVAVLGSLDTIMSIEANCVFDSAT